MDNIFKYGEYIIIFMDKEKMVAVTFLLLAILSFVIGSIILWATVGFSSMIPYLAASSATASLTSGLNTGITIFGIIGILEVLLGASSLIVSIMFFRK